MEISELPGPRRLPLVGNLPALFARGTPHRVFQEWGARYGTTYRMRMPGRDAVVTSEPEMIETILRERPDSFRRFSLVSDLIRELGAHGLFDAEGEDWRRLRRVATRGLSARYIRASFGTITRAADRLRDRWRTQTSVDVVEEMLSYTLEVSVGLTMGHELRDDDRLRGHLKEVFNTLGRRIASPVPYWRWVRLPADRRADEAIAAARSLITEKYVDARRRMLDGEEPADFLTALAKADVDGEDPLNLDDVVGNVLTLVVAGEDTTAGMISWVLHCLAAHPQAQERIRAEATAPITAPSALAALRYTEAVVHETMRLYPPTPYFPFEPVADTTIAGLRIPRGTPLWIMMTHGADKDREFRPERWLDGNPMEGRQPYLPFGSGPRFCPGRSLALMEATLMAATLCRAFVVEPDPSAGPVGEKVTFAVFPTNLRLRLSPVKRAVEDPALRA
ncbi:cytochrome P450 [Virgisporangium aliadipatigenens]|uniref:Cytochrome P450 n=1 Tax=Virgisporangium aliadipatigenens TaxID=741659 RepID=A0A8J4DUK1_9ACTN|nr:cytochrome P450 [Virgisporangium aliadipatigenens]GIJ49257.1 cytochrome P450 [Virgisporangium aliadipatigenens]